MSLPIEEFMEQLRQGATNFEAAYRKRAEETPEIYPLTMADGNEGLWLEFFIGFMETGSA